MRAQGRRRSHSTFRASVQGKSVFTGIPSTYHTITGRAAVRTPELHLSNLVLQARADLEVPCGLEQHRQFDPDRSVQCRAGDLGHGRATIPAKSGNALDTLRERLMVQSQYTNRGGVESLWLTHTVANPGNAALTVAAMVPAQRHAAAPSSRPDRCSNPPGLPTPASHAGCRVSPSTKTGTWRSATARRAPRCSRPFVTPDGSSTDPANTLGQTETSLIEGTASQCCNFSDGSVNNRWGDYSAHDDRP